MRKESLDRWITDPTMQGNPQREEVKKVETLIKTHISSIRMLRKKKKELEG